MIESTNDANLTDGQVGTLKTMLKLRESDLATGDYFGKKWLILKGILFAFACTMVYDGQQAYIGWLMLGYLVGTITASIRGFNASKKSWWIQERFVDWAAIESAISRHAKEKPQAPAAPLD